MRPALRLGGFIVLTLTFLATRAGQADKVFYTLSELTEQADIAVVGTIEKVGEMREEPRPGVGNYRFDRPEDIAVYPLILRVETALKGEVPPEPVEVLIPYYRTLTPKFYFREKSRWLLFLKAAGNSFEQVNPRARQALRIPPDVPLPSAREGSPQESVERLLVYLLGRGDEDFRVRAIEMLSYGRPLTPSPYFPAAKAASQPYVTAEAQAAMEELLAGENPRLRLAAASAMCRMNHIEAIPILEEAAGMVRGSGSAEQDIFRLAEVTNPAALPSLNRLALAADWRLRRGAGEALRRIDDYCSISFMLSALEDEDLPVRGYASGVLAGMTGLRELSVDYAWRGGQDSPEAAVASLWKEWFAAGLETRARAQRYAVAIDVEPQPIFAHRGNRARLEISIREPDGGPAAGTVRLMATFGKFAESAAGEIEVSLDEATGRANCYLQLARDALGGLRPDTVYLFKGRQLIGAKTVETRRLSGLEVSALPTLAAASGEGRFYIHARLVDDKGYIVHDFPLQLSAQMPDGSKITESREIGRNDSDVVFALPPSDVAGEAVATVEVEGLPARTVRLHYLERLPRWISVREALGPWGLDIVWREARGELLAGYYPRPEDVDRRRPFFRARAGQTQVALGDQEFQLLEAPVARDGELMAAPELIYLLMHQYGLRRMPAVNLRHTLPQPESQPVGMKMEIADEYRCGEELLGIAGVPIPVRFLILPNAAETFDGLVKISVERGLYDSKVLFTGAMIEPRRGARLFARPQSGVIETSLTLLDWRDPAFTLDIEVAGQKDHVKIEVPRRDACQVDLQASPAVAQVGGGGEIQLRAAVTDGRGRPVPRFPVSFETRLQSPGADDIVRQYASRTDGEGIARLALPDLGAPGLLTVTARAGGFHSATEQARWTMGGKDYAGADLQARLDRLIKQFAEVPSVDAGRRRVEIARDFITLGEPGITMLCGLLKDGWFDKLPLPRKKHTGAAELVALELGKTGSKAALETLREFYYAGARAKNFSRPVALRFRPAAHNTIATATDEDGMHWALVTQMPSYGGMRDVWLARSADGENWGQPLFVGAEAAGGAHITDSSNIILPPARLCVSERHFKAAFPIYRRGAEPYLYETQFALADLTRDTDADGLYDVEEMRFGTDPQKSDSDSDGLLDGMDLNPLAAPAKGPLSDEKAIRQAIFRLQAPRDEAVIFVRAAPDERQEYLGAGLIVPKTEEEILDLRSSAGSGVPVIYFDNLEISHDRSRATIKFTDYRSPLGARIYEIELRRVVGLWVAVEILRFSIA